MADLFDLLDRASAVELSATKTELAELVTALAASLEVEVVRASNLDKQIQAAPHGHACRGGSSCECWKAKPVESPLGDLRKDAKEIKAAALRGARADEAFAMAQLLRGLISMGRTDEYGDKSVSSYALEAMLRRFENVAGVQGFED